MGADKRSVAFPHDRTPPSNERRTLRMCTHNCVDELKMNMQRKKKQMQKSIYYIVQFVSHFRVRESNYSEMIKTRLVIAWVVGVLNKNSIGNLQG